jgi:hypothetical protein
VAERHLFVGSPDDAELITLGKQIEPLHATYWGAVDQFEARRPGDDLDAVEAEFRRADAELRPVLKAVSALPANTEVGRRIKLRAWAHCDSYDLEALEEQIEGAYVREALVASMFRDLCREQGVVLRVRPRLELADGSA